jgi:hypothetical protein
MTKERLTFFIVALSTLMGCDSKVNNLYCDIATLCVRNPSATDIVIFEWGDAQVQDTILPGECATRKSRDIFIKYDKDGEITDSYTRDFMFTADGKNYRFTLDECYKEIDAPGGFFNPTTHCFNTTFDPDMNEQNTDCGGLCTPCELPLEPCPSLQPSYFQFTHVSQGAGEYQSGGAVSFDDNEYVKALFYLDPSREIEVLFYVPELPNYSRKFITGSEPHEARVFLNQAFDDRYATPGQELFLIKDPDETYRVVFCDLEFPESPNSTQSWSAFANLELIF